MLNEQLYADSRMVNMRIILADHHPQTLWALKTSLQERPDLEIVGVATAGADLLELAKKTIVDLIMIDRNLPGALLDNLIADLHALEPRPIVIGMSSNVEEGRMMLKAGVDAFVSKGDPPDWLFETLYRFAIRFEKKDDLNEQPYHDLSSSNESFETQII